MVNSVCSSCAAQTKSAELLAQRLEEKKSESAEVAKINREETLGQAAKAEITKAQEAARDLPDKMKDKIASGITRGADAQSVFEALIVADQFDGKGRA